MSFPCLESESHLWARPWPSGRDRRNGTLRRASFCSTSRSHLSEVTWRSSTPRRETRRAGKKQAEEWFALAEQLTETDAVGAEQAYRKVLELAPSPHYHAYTNLGVLLCEAETRCDEALSVFDGAFEHFPDDALLHFNRAVVLEELKRYDAAEDSLSAMHRT